MAEPVTYILKWNFGEESGEHLLPPGDYTIGRGSQSPVVLRDPALSREQFRLTLTATDADIWDPGSKNRTRVNDLALVRPHRLQPGDVINAGRTRFEIFRPMTGEAGEILRRSTLILRPGNASDLPTAALEPLGRCGVIGSSPAVVGLLHTLAKIARTEAPVLILGESGSGKELFARAIHQLSPRREGQMLAINCAAIPDELLEAEFFGHPKGAFTGAMGERAGHFATADSGTLFLDELAELPGNLQAALLRVVETGEYLPVGSSVPRKSRARIVTATNEDLEKRVAVKAFREDLFFRLNVFTLKIPPLRERREDIPELCRYFLARFGERYGVAIPPLGPEELAFLANHPFPGNIRELKNLLERWVVLGEFPRLKTSPTPPPGTPGVAETRGAMALALRS